MTSDETILVTGGAGYLGSALCHHLAGTVRIRILDNVYRDDHRGLFDLPEAGEYEFIEGDIMDPHAVRRALTGVKTVVHLAALVRTPFSFDHPTWTRHVNHWGTSRLVELAREADVEHFVFASSTSVYGSGGPFTEDDPLRPVGPYSVSKAEAEKVVRTAHTPGFDTTILRLATLYGMAPAVRFDAVPNRFAYLAAARKPLTVYGSGEQLRPVVHVDDAVTAIHQVLEPGPERGSTLNVVSENPSIREMAVTVKDVAPFARVVHTAQDAMTHITLEVSGERLAESGWSADRSVQEGMTEILGRVGPFAAGPTGTDLGLDVVG